MKNKHVPERTCVGCRQAKPKRDLIRVVRDPLGQVDIDYTGKKNGRGIYLCPNLSCLEAALKTNRMGVGLQTEIPAEVIARLREKMQGAG
ncbi:MAG: hypothetical protein DDT34_00327 [Firmicutes bacterium]|nr:hypothetical protein [Bacillota bacterium]MBT9157059.1 hypothetical protein [Bacillota bacterium]